MKKQREAEVADDEDPRFVAVLRELETDPTFAAIVSDYRERRQAGGRSFGSNALRVNDKLFAMVVRGRLVVKLPKERVDALVTARRGEAFDPGHGRKMKEWLSLVSKALPWIELIREAHAFVKEASPKKRSPKKKTGPKVARPRRRRAPARST